MKKILSTNLILFGYKASGKTFLGKLFAEKFNQNFIDTDHLVEKLYKKRFQVELNCREISLEIGQNGFQQLEKEVVNSLKHTTNSIISVGGATVLDSNNCSSLKKNGILVFLEVEKKVIKQRILNNKIPSFFNTKEPEKSFEEMYQKRKKTYEMLSKIKVKTKGKTPSQILDELWTILQTAKAAN